MKKSIVFIKNEKGLTYVELLVAFSLLAIIVVLFTPMFMLSYNNLYSAGQKGVETYGAKSYIEQQLATRQDDDYYSGGFSSSFLDSSGTALEAVNIAARRVYHNTVTGLETLYYGNKVYVRIISDTEMPDDTAMHLISVATTNLNLTTGHVKALCSVTGSSNISSAVLGTDYTTGPFTLTGTDAIIDVSSPMATLTPSVTITTDASKNLISIKIDNTDITTSIIKVTVYYKDENKTTKMISNFVEVEPATIMVVGQTKANATYFTTGGLSDAGSIFLSGRVMTEGASTTAVGTDLKVVKWIYNDATIAEGYYVIGGANGTIRRLWHINTTTASALGVTQSTTAAAAYSSSTAPGYYSYYDNNTFYYKYTWNGDYSNIYYRYHYDKTLSVTSYYSFITMAYYMSQFNGYGSGYSYASSRMRRISYAVEDATSSDFTSRGAGQGAWIKYCDSVYNKYIFPWWKYRHANGSVSSERYYCFSSSTNYWYKTTGYNSYTVDTALVGKNAYDTNKNAIGLDYSTYTRDWVGTADIWDSSNECQDGNDGDGYLSMLVLKNYNNYVGSAGVNYLIGGNYNTCSTSPLASNPPIITDVAYVEGLSSGYTSGGSLLYIGVTPANAVIDQTTGVSTDDDTKGVFKTFSYISNTNCIGCTLRTATQATSAGSDSTYAHNAYIAGTDVVTSLSDLNMTMGYASNRTLVYGTLDAFKTKAYEADYFATLGYTPSDYKHNVWFTSEFYNLTKEATVEALTIAVGYTVSGYASQGYTIYTPSFDHSGDPWNYNTSMGSQGYDSSYLVYTSNVLCKAPANGVAYTQLDTIVNDAIITAFQNGDSTTTTSMKTVYYLRTSDRTSVRFTAVDVGVTSSNSQYCLAVGDSKGRVHLAVLDVDSSTRRINLNQIKNNIRVVLDTATSPFSQINSVSVSKSGIIVTGISKTSGRTYVALLDKDTNWSTCTGSDWTIIEVKNAGGASVQYDGNDIELIGDTYYIAGSYSSATKGVLLYCKAADVDSEAAWKGNVVLQYTTAYDIDSSGSVVGSGTAYDLPPLYSLAGK